MFTTTSLGVPPKEQEAHDKRQAELKKLQETRLIDLLKLAKKMKMKVPAPPPPQTELVEMIAKKKGLYHG